MKIDILLIFPLFNLLSCKKNEFSESEINSFINSDDHMSEIDKEFLKFPASDCIFAITISAYARQNSKDKRVIEIANMMMVLCRQFHNELDQWANATHCRLPKKMTSNQQKSNDELFSKKGLQLDYAFIDLLAETNKKKHQQR